MSDRDSYDPLPDVTVLARGEGGMVLLDGCGFAGTGVMWTNGNRRDGSCWVAKYPGYKTAPHDPERPDDCGATGYE